jgi:SHS2 domain-containing protein
MPPSFRVLDDIAIADVAFEATGSSPSELCCAAAQALVETLADPQTVSNTWHRTIDLEHETFPESLFFWLSEIIYWKDADGVVFSRASASVVSEGIGPWRLHGELAGEAIDSTRQDLRADVKAVTKHLYDVHQDDGQWKATVVLDI